MSHEQRRHARRHREAAARLTRREREIVNAVFACSNRASAEAIRAHLTSPPSSSSVRVMLTRLEQKGYLKHEAEGVRYMYSATTPPTVARKSALQQYLKTFFSGSLPQMLTSLVREESWQPEDLDRLRAEIDRARREGQKS
jgi:predicted transcriptional regulator